jgi:hypothetical protein
LVDKYVQIVNRYKISPKHSNDRIFCELLAKLTSGSLDFRGFQEATVEMKEARPRAFILQT